MCDAVESEQTLTMKAAVVASTRIAARTVARQCRCMSIDLKDKSKYYFTREDPPVRFVAVGRDIACCATVLYATMRISHSTNVIFRPLQYKQGKHRSNALELVSKQPVIEVDGEMAICDGGGGSLGHPVEYISLQRPGVIETCKYCALKYKSKVHDH